MEPKKLSFLIKAVYDVLPTPVNRHAWGLTTSDRCRACGKTASLKHILTGCVYALRSYTWRHNEVLEIFSEVSKTCCETSNKALKIINNRAIQFVKEGNISKIARENMRKPSLLEGCTDWHVVTDLKHNFIFPTEIALTTKRSVRQGCSLSPLLYILTLEPLLHRLRDEGTSPVLRGVPFAAPLTAKVSAFADDITFFVSRRLDIKAVKKAVGEYERITGAKVNFDKSEGLRLGAWRGSNTLPGPFRWSDGPVRILGV